MKPRKPAARGLDVALKTAKSRSASSQRWLSRQLNDPYVAAARATASPARARRSSCSTSMTGSI
jgi:23S rRNA (uridine2552-2'-O)-methyltransferase